MLNRSLSRGRLIYYEFDIFNGVIADQNITVEQTQSPQAPDASWPPWMVEASYRWSAKTRHHMNPRSVKHQTIYVDQLRTSPRRRADSNVSETKQQDRDNSYPKQYGIIDNYAIQTRIGRGKYSNVFKGVMKDRTPCVIKVLKPVREQKIQLEIEILQKLQGGPNITQLLDVVKDVDSGSIALILSWCNNEEFRTILTRFKLTDIAIYTYKVLQALEFAHGKGIMHRDVKPGNIMFDSDTHELFLIDWGLADIYQQGQSYNDRVATRHYKGPELLFEYRYYEPSLDIWCLGCTLAAMLFRKTPFFRGKDPEEQIIKLCEIFGSEDMFNYVEKYQIQVPPHLFAKMGGYKKTPWSAFYQDKGRDCEQLCTPEALDLLTKMLTIDHKLRPTATEAMQHPFFDPIRKMV